MLFFNCDLASDNPRYRSKQAIRRSGRDTLEIELKDDDRR